MMPSQQHPNRQAHNWLIYNISDALLLKNTSAIKGVLLDLGCGNKTPYKPFFMKYATTYIGMDWQQSPVENIDIVADLNKTLPLSDQCIDTIVSLSVLEHIKEPQQLINEMFRLLKNEGNLIIQVPWQWSLHEMPHDYFRYTPSGLYYLLQKSGFSEIKITAQSGIFTTIILKINYFIKRFIPKEKYSSQLAYYTFLPFWFFGQHLAPLLDKLDRTWSYESSGYYLTATKNS